MTITKTNYYFDLPTNQPITAEQYTALDNIDPNWFQIVEMETFGRGLNYSHKIYRVYLSSQEAYAWAKLYFNFE